MAQDLAVFTTVVWVWSLALELPHTTDAAQKKKNKNQLK